jgi:hypothetical protein
LRLAVDQERRGLDAAGGINESREAVGPIIAVAGEQPRAPYLPGNSG